MFKKIPSILSRYCTWLKDIVYSKPRSGAGVAAITDPTPANLPILSEREDWSWKPATNDVESTLGLKSNKFFKFTMPYTEELKEGIRSSVTPASWI